MSNARSKSLRLSSKQNAQSRDLTDNLGKLPPQAIDLEEAVLGAIMLERRAITQVIEILKQEDFYLEKHREIYQACVDLFRKDDPIDMKSVTHQLRRTGKLELVGGAYTTAELTSRVSSAANIEHDARIIVEMAIKRRLITMASQVHNEAFDDTTDVFEVLERSQRHFDEISGVFLTGNVKTSKAIFTETITDMLAGRGKEGLIGVPSGFGGLDRMTAGWIKTELTIIAARPGMGKTAFVVNALRNAAVDFKLPVAMFSLEMGDKQLMQRMIAAESEIELDKIIKCTYSDADLIRINHQTARLASAPIFIDDTPALTILELRAKCRRLKAEHNVQLIVVDYLQLMRGDEDAGNREQEIASISRGLKGIAKDLDVPVLALSQLSRGVETRGGEKRPQLSDLRESGSIEQDADKVMFLYRPEYYKITVYEDGSPTQGVMEVIVAKNRNGACDTVKVKFIGRISKVTDFDDFELSSSQSLPLPAALPNGNFKHYKSNQVSRREHDEPPTPSASDDETPF